MEKIERAKKEKNKAKQEAKVTRLAVGEAKVRAEDELARMLDAMANAEEDGRGPEAEVACLTVERTSFLLELQAFKDEVLSFHSQAVKDNEAMVEDYQKALEQIFAYGYGCCVFKHGIRGDRPRILDGMPDSTDPLPLEFFANQWCPLASAPVEAKAVEVHSAEATKDPVEGTVLEELG